MFSSTRFRFSTPVMAVMILVVASGCAGSSSEAGGSGEGGSNNEYASPLADFLGYSSSNFDVEDEQDKWAEQERLVEEQVAACMQAEGFEYQPQDSSHSEMFVEEDEFEWGSAEFVAKYGFGASTQYFSQDQVGPDLVGHNYPTFMTEEDHVDPNQEYIDSLGESGQKAYHEALHGTDQGPEWDESLSDEENSEVMQEYYENEYVPTGCYNVAWEGSQDQEANRAFDELFGDRLTEMYERLQADPRAAAILDETAACVGAKGYEYDEENTQQEFYEKLEEIGNRGMEDPFADVDMDTMTDEEAQAIIMEAEKLSPEDLVKLAEIQELELATAAAVFECNDGFLFSHQNPELQKIRIELEQQFLDDNAEELAEFEGLGG